MSRISITYKRLIRTLKAEPFVEVKGMFAVLSVLVITLVCAGAIFIARVCFVIVIGALTARYTYAVTFIGVCFLFLLVPIEIMAVTYAACLAANIWPWLNKKMYPRAGGNNITN